MCSRWAIRTSNCCRSPSIRLTVSWGYQTTGYFAPTSRFGTPDDFKYFVDYCHQHGIGVILDWVPAHFPRMHTGWLFLTAPISMNIRTRARVSIRTGAQRFSILGATRFATFLLSSALFWLKEYHLDGLRVDAVASMLYLDYSREGGDWVPNRYGGRENLEAIDFIRRFNEVMPCGSAGHLDHCRRKHIMAHGHAAHPIWAVWALTYKWNMGWMHDMLNYMQKDPIHRRYHQNQITFSLIYAFQENFVLPFSHDEVVHLKRSMLDKMPGDVWQKYANLRALYSYMAGHPGKKLLFMGSEFGQWAEWNEARSIDWHLLQWQDHQQLQRFVTDLNHLYLAEAGLASGRRQLGRV